MTEQSYTAVPGSRLKDRDAAVIGPVIARIAQEHGAATAEDLLKSAENHASPIHGYFEWDDKAAGHAHRLTQAGYFIRSIRIVIETRRAPVETRAFHVTTQGEQRGYRPASQVFADADLSAQVVYEALRKLSSWRATYANYRKAAKLEPVFNAIDAALQDAPEATHIAAE